MITGDVIQIPNAGEEQTGNNNEPTDSAEQGDNGTISGQNINMNVNKSNKNTIGAGIKSALEDRFNKQSISKFAKKSGKKTIKGAAKLAGGAALGTVALGAAVATGDPKNALAYTMAGMAAGRKLSGKIADKGMKEVGRTREAYKKGRLGADEYNAKKTISELKGDRNFALACKTAGITGKGQEELIRQFMNNGITNKEEILKALETKNKYEKKHRDKIDTEQLIDLAVFNQGIGDNTWSDREKRTQLLDGVYERLKGKGYKIDDIKKVETIINGMKS